MAITPLPVHRSSARVRFGRSASSARSTSTSVSGRGTSTSGVDREAAPVELALAEDVRDRFAPAACARPARARARARRGRAGAACPCTSARGRSQRVAEQQLGVEPRRRNAERRAGPASSRPACAARSRLRSARVLGSHALELDLRTGAGLGQDLARELADLGRRRPSSGTPPSRFGSIAHEPFHRARREAALLQRHEGVDLRAQQHDAHFVVARCPAL